MSNVYKHNTTNIDDGALTDIYFRMRYPASNYRIKIVHYTINDHPNDIDWGMIFHYIKLNSLIPGT